MEFKKYIKDNILVFDGAMGTMLQSKGLKMGDLPESFNITHPDILIEIHKQYVMAGCDVVSTNTFGASELKLKGSGYTPEEIIDSGVKIAKKSGAKYVALDIGPLGQLMEPMGSITFEKAYELFKQQVIAGKQAGADIILMETFSDIYEAKAAILAAKENTNLPVICSLTYQEDGRTFVGTDPVTGTIALQSYGVDALGVNCSLGPKELMPVVEKILEYSSIPVIVQANAGIPKIKGKKTIYDISERDYAGYVKDMVKKGVSIVGGCCGTTPDFIKHIKKAIIGIEPVKTQPKEITAVTSGSKTIIFDNKITVIGERINPTGKSRLKQALKDHKMDYIINEAVSQTNSGADILDINVGLPEIDEAKMIKEVVRHVQSVTNLPLQIDSSDINAIEAGVRIYNGRPMINSVNGKKDSMDKILPIVKKYGAVVVALTLDENGIPATAQGRYEIAEKIVNTAAEYGIPKKDIVIDCLTLTASAQQEQVIQTIEAIKLVKTKLGVKTTLGVSNVSFGLPNRPLLNSTFLSAAFGAGLDAPIINPLSIDIMRAVDTFRVINYQDIDSKNYIQKYSNIQNQTLQQSGDNLTIKDLIIQGLKEKASQAIREQLKTTGALDLIDNHFIPALDIVGEKYEKGEVFLPGLMQSAEVVKSGFEIIKQNFDISSNNQNKGTIVVATVYGDIHDIGKNIAKMLLENYGYKVVDLGKDVPSSQVVQAIKQHKAKLVGLSALMTTTVNNMKTTIEDIKKQGLDCKIMVGGAVLNEEYANFVGADKYVKDGREGVIFAQKVFGD